jgi:hypothetical protein
MDMDLPIVDILASVAESNGPPAPHTIYCDREQFEQDVELYAPGYLALEATGKGGEYDLRCLTEPDEIPFDRKPAYQRMMEDLMAGRYSRPGIKNGLPIYTHNPVSLEERWALNNR